MDDSKKLINCHTHIFTIDHVPNEFGKSLLPWPFYKIFTIRLVKWYYTNLTARGSLKFRRFIHQKDKFIYGIKNVLKATLLLWGLYLLVFLIVRWVARIMLNFLKLESFFSPEVKSLIGALPNNGPILHSVQDPIVYF